MIALCVRCGRGPRFAGTFLCPRCLTDPATRREVAKAEGMATDGVAQRQVLIARSHWAGGWPRVQ